ncbi:ZIP zinc transporter [Xylariomycetidae sp. FL0641]|nr:ZIP zinc transporter [Xylariomycetidae sp. FL0641]
MEVAEMDNDLRGWIMCIVSGVACVLGAGIICVDSIVRLFPGKKDFRIQDSNSFLACSLSLSFGVMLFMSLNSMLPEAKEYLRKGGFDEQRAGFILMGCFVAGFVGIQILSRLFHQFIPSHVVDCDHSHDEHALEDHPQPDTGRRQSSRARSADRRQSLRTHVNEPRTRLGDNGLASESTPLLTPSPRHRGNTLKRSETAGVDHSPDLDTIPEGRRRAVTYSRRPSMVQVQRRVMSFVKDTKTNCDNAGPCYGYSDPCGQECFKHLSRSNLVSRAPTFLRSVTGMTAGTMERVAEDGNDDDALVSPTHTRSRATTALSEPGHGHEHDGGHNDEEGCDSVNSEDLEAQHHHHVAENAFLSIGLQTSVAIALHKFPEGFITYATNHANPSLGFNVFLALFVHNISEGFALALPLYMALNSRLRAIIWSFVLGGLSQPLGAGIAVLWFSLAKHTHMTPDAVAYGCLFSITAGIMASVALQLFVESLSLNHNKNLSILFAFSGMTLLGLSSAFTSDVH